MDGNRQAQRRSAREGHLLAAASLAGAACVAASIPQAVAQEFPQKPLRIVVGPGPDIVGRMLGQHYTEAWGQPTVIDPRPGGVA